MNVSRFRLCAVSIVLLFSALVISVILMQLKTWSVDVRSHVDEGIIRQDDFDCYYDGKICKGLE